MVTGYLESVAGVKRNYPVANQEQSDDRPNKRSFGRLTEKPSRTTPNQYPCNER